MEEERKESDPEFQYNFQTDMGYREINGQDASTHSNARAVLRGAQEITRRQVARQDDTSESTFRSTSARYLEASYVTMSPETRQAIINRAVEVPNYLQLYQPILLASIYFQLLAPDVTSTSQLTSERFLEFASTVMRPILFEAEGRSTRRQPLAVQLNGDLLRYLRLLYSDQ